jgi:poly(hydroxyalkanoate) granule-associated protein
MVKKLKSQAKEEDRLFADAVRISAQQIWQAGLGAFAKAQEEGEDGGGQVFNKLVAEGTQMQQRGGPASDDGVAGMSDTVTGVADGAGEGAAGSWDKLERVFEERVGRALGAIGVPTRQDVEALTRQVEQLARMVEQLSGGQGPARLGGKVAIQAAGKAEKTPRKTVAKAAGRRKPAAAKAGAAPGAGD